MPPADPAHPPPADLLLSRRQFFGRSSAGIGGAALASLLNPALLRAAVGEGATHFAPKAKRVIYLFMHGGPSQLDLFDHKPDLATRRGEELPDSVRGTQRLTGMTSGQKNFPVTPSIFRFARHGRSGMWVSELLPHTARCVDDLALVRSVHTNAINHDPACTSVMTGSEVPGKPSLGSWLSYGL
ncbi:MAG: DUF1501 domain-containing protein, partial [Opitutaceae bacterium]